MDEKMSKKINIPLIPGAVFRPEYGTSVRPKGQATVMKTNADQRAEWLRRSRLIDNGRDAATIAIPAYVLVGILEDLALEMELRDGVLSMAVARLGGIVEGNPTGRHNFLQRIDELVAIEARAVPKEK